MSYDHEGCRTSRCPDVRGERGHWRPVAPSRTKSDLAGLLPSDLIRDRVQEIGGGRGRETQNRSPSLPGGAPAVSAPGVQPTGVSVAGDPDVSRGVQLALPA